MVEWGTAAENRILGGGDLLDEDGLEGMDDGDFGDGEGDEV